MKLVNPHKKIFYIIMQEITLVDTVEPFARRYKESEPTLVIKRA
jgi:hypothetical protein